MAFYKLVIDRLVNVVVILWKGDYSVGDLGLFDYSSWRLTTNFIPFETIFRYINYSQYFNWDTIIINLLGNLLIFTPMGFFTAITIEEIPQSRRYTLLRLFFPALAWKLFNLFLQ
ncbi:VanZ family protein [Lysinibacillus sp. MHQ-1]|nr:VanZ family protein [Lysinibacillus sp. MHQ-1]